MAIDKDCRVAWALHATELAKTGIKLSDSGVRFAKVMGAVDPASGDDPQVERYMAKFKEAAEALLEAANIASEIGKSKKGDNDDGPEIH